MKLSSLKISGHLPGASLLERNPVRTYQAAFCVLLAANLYLCFRFLTH